MFYPHTIKGKVNLRLDLIAGLPANTSPPVISGDTAPENLLTVTPGSWTGTGSIVLTYQWLRDGLEIIGETATTYTTLLTDDGTAISCLEFATDDIGTSQRVSNSLNIASISITPPDDIGGIRLWVDGDTGYIDKAGIKTVTNSGSTIVAGPNGHSAFNFNGSSQYINITEEDHRNIDFFIVMKPNELIESGSPAQPLLGTVAGALGHGLIFTGAWTGSAPGSTLGGFNRSNNPGNAISYSTTDISADWHIMEIHSNGANTFGINVDDAPHTVSEFGGGLTSSVPRLQDINTIGRLGSTYLTGIIAEVIMYDNKLSTMDRASVISYLQNKYNL